MDTKFFEKKGFNEMFCQQSISGDSTESITEFASNLKYPAAQETKKKTKKIHSDNSLELERHIQHNNATWGGQKSLKTRKYD